jgi:predicted unusual protein kinase regulating ubiquinone biosynthesis (AarF/ABC1/UbiB family)
VQSVEDLQRYLAAETDFGAEVRSLQRFGALYPATHATVRVPKVYASLSTARAVVMEDVPSVGVHEAYASSGSARRRCRLAKAIMGTFVHQLIGNGVLHGDPHNGNMGVDLDGRLVMYDFGSVIELDPDDVCHLKDCALFLMTGNLKAVVGVLRRMGAEILDEELLIGYVEDYRRYSERQLKWNTRRRRLDGFRPQVTASNRK